MKILKWLPVALGLTVAALVASGRGGQARSSSAPASRNVAAPVASVAANPARGESLAADGWYTSREEVARYLRTYGKLPGNFITKAEARRLGWTGGPLEPYAPGKSIGGDHFGNYERRLPAGRYRECDIDTRGKPRGAKRLIYTDDKRQIYYTGDHYRTFEKVP